MAQTAVFIHSLINKRTGHLLKQSFGGDANQEDILYADVDSQLLTTREEIKDEHYVVKSIILRMYIIDNGQLELIKTVKGIDPTQFEEKLLFE